MKNSKKIKNKRRKEVNFTKGFQFVFAHFLPRQVKLLNVKKVCYSYYLLQDIRVQERQKPGQPGSRKQPTWKRR